MLITLPVAIGCNTRHCEAWPALQVWPHVRSVLSAANLFHFPFWVHPMVGADHALFTMRAGDLYQWTTDGLFRPPTTVCRPISRYGERSSACPLAAPATRNTGNEIQGGARCRPPSWRQAIISVRGRSVCFPGRYRHFADLANSPIHAQSRPRSYARLPGELPPTYESVPGHD